MFVLKENINDNDNNFKIICKSCNSNNISLQIINGDIWDDVSDEYYFVCNNCKNNWNII